MNFLQQNQDLRVVTFSKSKKNLKKNHSLEVFYKLTSKVKWHYIQDLDLYHCYSNKNTFSYRTGKLQGGLIRKPSRTMVHIVPLCEPLPVSYKVESLHQNVNHLYF